MKGFWSKIFAEEAISILNFTRKKPTFLHQITNAQTLEFHYAAIIIEYLLLDQKLVTFRAKIPI